MRERVSLSSQPRLFQRVNSDHCAARFIARRELTLYTYSSFIYLRMYSSAAAESAAAEEEPRHVNVTVNWILSVGDGSLLPITFAAIMYKRSSLTLTLYMPTTLAAFYVPTVTDEIMRIR